MPNSMYNQQLNAEFQRLSPEAQAYIKQLERESAILRYFDLLAGELSPSDTDTYHTVFRTTLLVTREAMELFNQPTTVN